MPSSQEHYRQAQSNESFYEALGADSSATPEWAMTVLFYAALHYAQAALIYTGKGPLPLKHSDRRKAIRSQFGVIAAQYEALYDDSIKARYECMSPTAQQLNRAAGMLRTIANEISKQAPPALYA